MYPLRVTGNINSITPPIGPKHSTYALSLILPHISKKALQSRLFIIPFFTSFLRFYQQSHTLHVMRLRDSKGLGNLLRINYVSPTSLHIRRALFSLFVHFFSSSFTAVKHNLSLSILAFFLLDL